MSAAHGTNFKLSVSVLLHVFETDWLKLHVPCDARHTLCKCIKDILHKK